ncbi:hypothetical protein MHU86_20359 [Fragilaria crotonensis]|nr:hypothetical protein MHU86_20359 [Fragilaria crotonensis]
MTGPTSTTPNQSEICRRCQVAGSDLKILDCGCFLHVRCTPVVENNPMSACPGCQSPFRAMKREKKRKTATIARLNPEVSVTGPNVEEASDDLRTGRWTTDEVLYCDKLVEKFESGELPVANGIKLNDFLSRMLKSKQSRLTKKMKNAKLSARAYSRTTGYVVDINECIV